MELHNLVRKTKNKKKKLVGRGGRRGKTSGRGTKGQLARSGRKLRPEFRDALKKLPKLRGYRFASIQVKSVTVSLGAINDSFANGDTVTPATLLEHGLISKKKGNIPAVKILSDGDILKNVTVSGIAFSKAAEAKITKAGGTITK